MVSPGNSGFEVHIEGDGLVTNAELHREGSDWSLRISLSETIGLDNGISHVNLRDVDTGQVTSSVNLANGDQSFALIFEGYPSDEPTVDLVFVGSESGVVAEDRVSIIDPGTTPTPSGEYGWDSAGEALAWIGGISIGLFLLFVLIIIIFG